VSETSRIAVRPSRVSPKEARNARAHAWRFVFACWEQKKAAGEAGGEESSRMEPMFRKTNQSPNDEPEQLSLWSEEEDTKLRCPSARSLPKDESLAYKTDGVRKACSSEGGVVQDELPFP
jgi:hypothetical protein